MILDCAGLDDASDSGSDDESSGLGDEASVSGATGAASANGVEGLVIGIEANLCRTGCLGDGALAPVLSLRDPVILPPEEPACPNGPSLETCGREAVGRDAVAVLGVPGVLPSFLPMAASLRTDKDDGARAWP